jgi:peptidoglycan/LPS O-acetylase OafA/YrhL
MTNTTQAGVNTPALTAPRPRQAHYQALDGLRGLAIITVLFAHTFGTSGHLKTTWLGGAIATVGNWGWLGVDLFFVLSGFLITGILIGTVNGPRYFRNFYIRRALRIFPLFYGVFLLLALLTPVLHLEWHIGHIAFLFYCQNIAMAVNPQLATVAPVVSLQHFWSLAVEEQYYMLWPLAIWLLRDERKIMRFCLMLIAGCIILRFALAALLPPNISIMLIYWELPTHCDGLLLGSWLALAIRRWPVEELRRRSRWLIWPAFAALLAAGAYAHSLDFQSPVMETVGFSVIPIVLAGLLLRCFVPGSPALRFCSLRFLQFMGRYSYGIYVYHVLFVPAMQRGLQWLQAHLHSRQLAGLVYLLLWYLSTVMVAVLSYKFFESPFLRLKERFAPIHETTTAPFVGQAEGLRR